MRPSSNLIPLSSANSLEQVYVRFTDWLYIVFQHLPRLTEGPGESEAESEDGIESVRLHGNTDQTYRCSQQSLGLTFRQSGTFEH